MNFKVEIGLFSQVHHFIQTWTNIVYYKFVEYIVHHVKQHILNMDSVLLLLFIMLVQRLN